MRGVILLCVLFHFSQIANAIDVTFTKNDIIQDGDDYGWVYVYGDTTTVNMTGGGVGNLWSYNSSTTNVSGGVVAYAQTNDQSTINISGGVIHEPRAWYDGTINVTDGECWNVEVGGGEFNISGGQITGKGIYVASGVANIYGYSFDYNSSRDPQLTGFWPDNTPFGITFWNPGNVEPHDSYDYVVLHEIPEPATLFLLGLGVVLIKKK